jgi:hypothetical protein
VPSGPRTATPRVAGTAAVGGPRGVPGRSLCRSLPGSSTPGRAHTGRASRCLTCVCAASARTTPPPTTSVLPADALPDIGPTASLERADIPADTLLLADTRLLFPLYREQERLADEGLGILAAVDPGILTADKFGLQRSTVRVEATTSPRPYGNPGVPVSGDGGDGDVQH